MLRVDLNSDVGESFGAYRLGSDDELFPFVSSVNIACGFHAGGPGIMRQTVACAAAAGVAIGAHPGLPDLAGFGRRVMAVTPDEVYDLVVYQIGALQAFTTAAGVPLQHVKPHGALYHMASNDMAIAEAVAQAVKAIDRRLIVFGLAGRELRMGSGLVHAARDAGLGVAAEGFADRRYHRDGSLVARGDGGLVVDPDEAARQAVRMIREGVVRAVEGEDLAIRVGTICIHGDTPNAAASAAQIRAGLEEAGIVVGPPKTS